VVEGYGGMVSRPSSILTNHGYIESRSDETSYRNELGVGPIGLRWWGFRLGLRLRTDGMAETQAELLDVEGECFRIESILVRR
jgi:hypothetical protein